VIVKLVPSVIAVGEALITPSLVTIVISRRAEPNDPMGSVAPFTVAEQVPATFV